MILPAVLLLAGLGLLAGGIFEIVVQQTGTSAKVTVVECHDTAGKYGGSSCTGTWVAGGDLVDGNGHVVIGTVDGAGPQDIGRTIHARLAGGRAYTTSLRVPIILPSMGLFITVVAVLVLRSALRRPASGQPAPLT